MKLHGGTIERELREIDVASVSLFLWYLNISLCQIHNSKKNFPIE